MVVNGRPLLAVQTHVPPENLVVSNSNQVLTVARVTDAVQAHGITSTLSCRDKLQSLLTDVNKCERFSILTDLLVK
jgi:hypothetical protein